MPEVLPDPSDPLGKLLAEIAEIKRQLRDMRGANPLENGTIRRGGLVFADDGAARSDDFEAGVSGWKVGGDSAEFNNLTLRGGIIGNDALTSPVEFARNKASAVGHALQVAGSFPAQFSFTVPVGYTRALVICVAQGNWVNTSGAADLAQIQASINGNTGGSVESLAGSGGTANATAASTELLEGLTPEGTFPVSAFVRTMVANWPANGSNITTVSAVATFLR